MTYNLTDHEKTVVFKALSMYYVNLMEEIDTTDVGLVITTIGEHLSILSTLEIKRKEVSQ